MILTQKCVFFSICPGQKKPNFCQIRGYQGTFVLENV